MVFLTGYLLVVFRTPAVARQRSQAESRHVETQSQA